MAVSVMEITGFLILVALLVGILFKINRIGKNMQAIQDFVAGQNTTLGQIETSVTAIQAIVTAGGTLSADDATALAGVQTRTQAIATSLANIVTPPAATP